MLFAYLIVNMVTGFVIKTMQFRVFWPVVATLTCYLLWREFFRNMGIVVN